MERIVNCPPVGLGERGGFNNRERRGGEPAPDATVTMSVLVLELPHPLAS